MLFAPAVAGLLNPARRLASTNRRRSAPNAADVSRYNSPTADNYLASLSSAPAAAEVSPPYEPSWEELTQVPVTLNANDWTALGKAKRLAVLCRLSVVHLTVISCASGGLLAGAAGKGNALRSALWTMTLCERCQRHNVAVQSVDRSALPLRRRLRAVRQTRTRSR